MEQINVVIYVPSLNSLRRYEDIYNDGRRPYQTYRDSLDIEKTSFYSKWSDGDYFKNGEIIAYDKLPDNVKAAFLLCE